MAYEASVGDPMLGMLTRFSILDVSAILPAGG